QNTPGMQLRAMAGPNPADPGRDMSRSIATGTVARSDRVRNAVAPNSPRQATSARPAPAPMAGRANGRSTLHHRSRGDAPSNDAASGTDFGIDASAGATTRTT